MTHTKKPNGIMQDNVYLVARDLGCSINTVYTAPKLLEACKATLEHMRQEVNDPIEWAEILENENTICHQLNKAIEKAEGTGKENDCY
jgi:hypothetical protein